MATLTCVSQDTQWGLRSQDFSISLTDTWANQQVFLRVLRAICSPKTGTPLFTYQHLADVCGYQHRHTIQNVQQEFEQCAEDLAADLARTRKVDATVVDAVTEVIRPHPLASRAQGCQQGSKR